MSEMNDFNQGIIEEFRANSGVVGGPFAGSPVVLISTTGAKSGDPRTNPLVCLPEDNGTIYIFGSAGGGPKNPDWYYNLLTHPEVGVEIGTEQFAATATPVTGTERDAVYARQAEAFPAFADYEKQTTRTIPVIALNRS
jgi:deazaflavin-dependent oxidoreductase (nitroreductase family)